MLRAIIIDDEPKALTTLEKNLKENCPQVEIVAVCQSGKEGLINIHKHKPDLIFLDIKMPGMNGFEMLQCLPVIDFHVIFTTSYDEFAIQALRISAVLDYLLKPIKEQELIEAVERVENQNERPLTDDQVINIQNYIGSTNKRIAIPIQGGLDYLPIAKIVYVKSEGSYINIYLTTGKTPKSPYTTVSISELEERLSSFNFYRINQSYLANIDYIKEYNRGEHYVTVEYLHKEKPAIEKLPVSRSKREQLLDKMKEI